MLEADIRRLFSECPDVLYGFASTGYSPYGRDFPSALVFAVPHGGQLTLDNYAEADFEAGVQAARRRVEELVERLGALLARRGARYFVPPVAQENEQELLAPFSFKFAAVNAGLGWIGKSDVLITRRYGPRVRLSAILIDGAFEYGTPVERSLCPDDCRKCVEVCPCTALKDRQWAIDAHRSDLIDYHRCNRMRSAFIPKLGRKSACGLCLAACPFGTTMVPPAKGVAK